MADRCWRLRRAAVLIGATGVCALAGGCRPSHTLETGYRYQPLNSSSVQQRAFYADRYSLEARRAEAERQQRARDMGVMPGLQQ